MYHFWILFYPSVLSYIWMTFSNISAYHSTNTLCLIIASVERGFWIDEEFIQISREYTYFLTINKCCIAFSLPTYHCVFVWLHRPGTWNSIEWPTSPISINPTLCLPSSHNYSYKHKRKLSKHQTPIISTKFISLFYFWTNIKCKQQHGILCAKTSKLIRAAVEFACAFDQSILSPARPRVYACIYVCIVYVN